MASRLKHRGPDAEGVFTAGNISLSHRRLSIIDLSAEANQPMQREDAVVVFNGEIYNFADVRKTLEQCGHRFTTSSDTEVLLAAYRQYGRDALSHFIGDFAFCIYDMQKNILFAARDRLGNKPFYYHHRNGHFLFASEVNAIGEIAPLTVNPQAAVNGVLFGISGKGEESLYTGIKHLLPAHWLEYSVADGTLATGRYWNLPEEGDTAEESLDTLLEQFDEIFTDAVRLRMIADVPVGGLLSGGLDSSLVAHHMARFRPDALFFTAGYHEHPEIDERHHVEELVCRFGWNVQYVYPALRPDDADFRRMVLHQGELFRSFSIFTQYLTVQQASRSLPVLLSGQGADELFGGYYHHIARFVAQNPDVRKMRAQLSGEEAAAREAAAGATFLLPEAEKLRKMKQDNAAALQAYQRATGDNTEPDWSILTEKFCADTRTALRRDTTTYSLPLLLRYEDRNGMAHSVENRTPFTDHRVVAFAHRLPDALRFSGGFSKYFLRRYAARFLPEQIAFRTDKLGFEAPEKHWMQTLGIPGAGNLVQFRIYLLHLLADTMPAKSVSKG